jgi:hypothetical protein
VIVITSSDALLFTAVGATASVAGAPPEFIAVSTVDRILVAST